MGIGRVGGKGLEGHDGFELRGAANEGDHFEAEPRPEHRLDSCLELLGVGRLGVERDVPARDEGLDVREAFLFEDLPEPAHLHVRALRR